MREDKRINQLSNTSQYLRSEGVRKTCGYTLCNNKIPVGDKYCESCKEEYGFKEYDATRHKTYTKYRRDKESDDFYQDVEWRGVRGKRNEIIKRDEGLCQGCLRNGIPKAGNIVHHIKPLKTHKHLAMDSNNLEYLCHDCHNKAHGSR